MVLFFLSFQTETIECFQPNSVLVAQIQRDRLQLIVKANTSLNEFCPVINGKNATATIQFNDATLNLDSDNIAMDFSKDVVFNFNYNNAVKFNNAIEQKSAEYTVICYGGLTIVGTVQKIEHEASNLTNCWSSVGLNYQKNILQQYINISVVPTNCIISSTVSASFQYLHAGKWVSVPIQPTVTADPAFHGFLPVYDHENVQFFNQSLSLLSGDAKTNLQKYFDYIILDPFMQARLVVDFVDSNIEQIVIGLCDPSVPDAPSGIQALIPTVYLDSSYAYSVQDLSQITSLVYPGSTQVTAVNASIFLTTSNNSTTLVNKTVLTEPGVMFLGNLTAIVEHQVEYVMVLSAFNAAKEVIFDAKWTGHGISSCVQKFELKVGQAEVCASVHVFNDTSCNQGAQTIKVKIWNDHTNVEHLSYTKAITVQKGSGISMCSAITETQRKQLNDYILDNTPGFQATLISTHEYSHATVKSIAYEPKIYQFAGGFFAGVAVIVVAILWISARRES
ncbi:Conserved_hypothetical protein [Hexamita inflata]|uniref:Uncharacterized protein n=1 Tax=Hexamita inflata TaxID=28002 RepID=A0AA86PRC5_9EUKA|nr:Conserved hypothetical protein [Hexamita inflata]